MGYNFSYVSINNITKKKKNITLFILKLFRIRSGFVTHLWKRQIYIVYNIE